MIKAGTLIKRLVEMERVLDAFLHNAREQCRMFVEGKISHAEQEMLIRRDMEEQDVCVAFIVCG